MSQVEKVAEPDNKTRGRPRTKKRRNREKPVDFNNVYFKLIAAVRSRENLWDTNNEHYRCKWKRDQSWAEIAKLLSLPVKDCVDMWDNKRCFFRRELQRMVKRNHKHSPWVYFPFMLFLKPLMPIELIDGIEGEQFYIENVFENITSFDRRLDEPVAPNVRVKKNIRKILQGKDVSDYEDEDDTDDDPPNIDDDEELLPMMPQSNEPKRLIHSTVSKVSLTKDQHTDYKFLLTFLPSLQNMTMQEKLQKRIEIMQLFGRQLRGLMETENDKSNSTNSTFVTIDYPCTDDDLKYFISLLPYFGKLSADKKLETQSFITDIYATAGMLVEPPHLEPIKVVSYLSDNVPCTYVAS